MSCDSPLAPKCREAWLLLCKFFEQELRPRFLRIASELELSPPQTHVLRCLSPGQPLPMSSLAETLFCDASNVTGLVDRLEARGLVERQGAEHDRRVKMLALSEAGQTLRDRLMGRLGDPSPALSRLSPEELRTLMGLLERVLDLPSPETKSQGSAAPSLP